MFRGARIYLDHRPEKQIRKSLWRNWVIAMVVIALVLRFSATGIGDWIPILVGLAGIPMGWLFGFKLGIQALFTGVYVFAEK